MVRQVYVLAAGLWLASGTVSAQHDLRALVATVPEGAVAVAAAADPAAFAQSLTAWLTPMPDGLPAELTAGLGFGLTVLDAVLGGSVAAGLQVLAGGGLVVAVLPAEAPAGWQFVAITRPPDLAAAEAWCARHATGVPRAAVGELLVFARARELLERVGAAAATPAGRWSELLAPPPAPSVAVAAVDLAALRERLGARAAAWSDARGVARVAFAPWLHVLAAAQTVHLDLRADAASLRLAARADASLRAVPGGLLLVDAAASARRGDLPPDGLAALTLDRSLRELLTDPGRFLTDDGVQAVQGFLSIADALDGPRTSFVDDLIGGLREPLQLCVLASAADDDPDGCPLVLPQFAVWAEVLDAAALPTLFRTATMLATIANAERAQRGEAPFQVRRLQDEHGHGLVAEPPPWRGPGRAPLDRQLSPTVWAAGGRVAVASTHAAALRALALPLQPTEAPADTLVLRGPVLAAALARSRSALVLGRMLDEGESAAEAQRFFAVVGAVAAALAELRLGVAAASADTSLELVLERRR